MLSRLEPDAGGDREQRVARKPRIGQRAPAHVEARTAVVPDDLHLRAAAAQSGATGVFGLLRAGRIVNHKNMFTSEAVTRGVRVRVESEYAPDRSEPAKNQWFFLYAVTIVNEGTETVQLLTRHWVIKDGTGHVEEVRGPGVVGKQPTLKPGESFEYTSGCPLTTPFGVMEGTYQMITAEGDRFDARIAPFTLSEPYTVH
jgi:ApaG protein